MHISTLDLDRGASLKDAKAAFSIGDYQQMLHFLIEGLLLHAAFEGWVGLQPSKTLRAYARELLTVQASLRENTETLSMKATASLTDTTSVFQMAAGLAEAVWFGQQSLDRDDAQRVLDAVAAILEQKGMEAS